MSPADAGFLQSLVESRLVFPELQARTMEDALTEISRRLDDVRRRVAGRPPVPLALVQIFDRALYAEAEGLSLDESVAYARANAWTACGEAPDSSTPLRAAATCSAGRFAAS